MPVSSTQCDDYVTHARGRADCGGWWLFAAGHQRRGLGGRGLAYRLGEDSEPGVAGVVCRGDGHHVAPVAGRDGRCALVAVPAPLVAHVLLAQLLAAVALPVLIGARRVHHAVLVADVRDGPGHVHPHRRPGLHLRLRRQRPYRVSILHQPKLRDYEEEFVNPNRYQKSPPRCRVRT
eukprot:3889563-Pyramimonas_sp.AAC.2